MSYWQNQDIAGKEWYVVSALNMTSMTKIEKLFIYHKILVLDNVADIVPTDCHFQYIPVNNDKAWVCCHALRKKTDFSLKFQNHTTKVIIISNTVCR